MQVIYKFAPIVITLDKLDEVNMLRTILRTVRDADLPGDPTHRSEVIKFALDLNAAITNIAEQSVSR